MTKDVLNFWIVSKNYLMTNQFNKYDKNHDERDDCIAKNISSHKVI